MTRSCCCLSRNQTIRCGILDHPVFLARSPAVLLVADVSVMAQALVAQPGSKASDDNPTDDDPDLLNFDVT
jgi:hypothetical protein